MINKLHEVPMFGEKFYRYLNEMKNWQRSLFALALAQRMSTNYILYCESIGHGEWAHEFKRILHEMWIYHTDKFNHIDLESLLIELEKRIPNPLPEGPYGAYPALDACVALSCSINAIISNVGDEAEVASNASVCTVAKFLEIQNDAEYDNDELREFDLINTEIEFQVELMQSVRKQRSEELVSEIKDGIIELGCSNIGIPAE
jgi:uncharacterized protein